MRLPGILAGAYSLVKLCVRLHTFTGGARECYPAAARSLTLCLASLFVEPPAEHFPWYEGLFRMVSLRMHMYLNYLKWYAEVALNPSASLQDFVDPPTYVAGTVLVWNLTHSVSVSYIRIEVIQHKNSKYHSWRENSRSEKPLLAPIR